MAMACKICTNKNCKEINKAILEGMPIQQIAAKYGVSYSSIRRHRDNHIPAKLAKAQEAREVTQADDLMGDLLYFKQEALHLLDDAKACGDIRSAIASIDQARKIVETLAEVRGEINRSNVVNVLVMPEFVEFREMIVHTLAPYPDAHKAVLKEIKGRL